jgi:hypothetical protein
MAVAYSLIFVSLLLFAGLAVDAGMLEGRYLQMQGAAKAAAVAASLEKRENQSWTYATMGQTAASANGYTNGVNGVIVTVENPPSSGSYAGNSAAFRAIVTQAVSTTFLGILGLGKVNMQAQALQLSAAYITLNSSFNINAVVTDNTTINNGGFDTSSFAFSANALGYQFNGMANGSRLSWRSQIFYTGAPNGLNGLANTTISLPSGQYSQLLILASTGYGPITGAQFVVKYTDGTTTTGTFNMSDWCNPQGYSGESIVVQAAYRDTNPNTQYANTTSIYGYSMNLNSTKTVSTLKLPTVRNVVVLALDVVP